MAESKPYRLPNTEGEYVTVPVTNQIGEIYRLNQNGTRTLFASYGLENGNLVVVSEPESSQEFQRNLAQNSQGYNRTISNSILDANNQTNSQPDPNQPGAPGGSTPANPNTPAESEKSQEKAFLIYPSDMSDNQDRIMFMAYEYESGGRLPRDSFEFELNSVKYVNPKQPVFLPIQSSITDQNSVGWEPDTLNPIELSALGLSSRLIDAEPGKEMTNVVGDALGQTLNLLKNNQGTREAIKNYIIGQAVGVNNLQSRLSGQVLNPNLELLFQGPQLRPFNFTFKLSPRDKDEARGVKQIIKYFKKNMAVKKDDIGLFLKAPNVFKIQYQFGAGKPHPGLNLIKMCALTNCSVDYTPLGTYMTYPDGNMVSYSISLSFQELTPIYDKDYDGDFNYGDTAGKVSSTYYTEDNGVGA